MSDDPDQDLDPDFQALLNRALALPIDAPNVVATEEDIAESLWQYGEEELELQVRTGLSEDEWQRITLAAGRIAESEGCMLALALARGAVVVLTGEDRPLARKRRRSR